MRAMSNKQRGVSLGGTIMVLILLILAGIATMKILPTYLDNRKIQTALDTIRQDPEMKNATIKAVRESFYKRAVIMNNITDVTENDVEVTKDANGLSLSVNYAKKIPLVANASLLLEFDTHSP